MSNSVSLFLNAEAVEDCAKGEEIHPMPELGTLRETSASSALKEGTASVLKLRNLLAQHFPHLRQGVAPRRVRETVATGVDALDSLLGGGLPRAELTELVASGNGSGSAEVIHALLRHVSSTRQFLALVDGLGSFDPGAVNPVVLSRLFWVRCREAAEGLKAMDLLLRDRNFALLVLDFKLNPARELRKISSSIWFRYARLVEQNSATVLVITPQALVSVARVRLCLESRLGIQALHCSRLELLACLRFKLLRSLADSERVPVAQAV